MGTNNSYIHLLFCNILKLLSYNSGEYKMHPLENKYFEELIYLFKEMGENVKSFEENKNFKSENFVSLYLIPDIYNTLESHKDFLNELIDEGDENLTLLFNTVHRYLLNFYKGKEINEDIKISLISLFKFLAQKYKDQEPFEKCEKLEYSSFGDQVSTQEIYAE